MSSQVCKANLLIDWKNPRAVNRVDIIERFDKLDEAQISERDPDWLHLHKDNGTLFGHISFQGLKVLARMKSLETVKVEITEADKRLCAVATVRNGNSQRAGAYSVPADCNGKLIAGEMATRNAYRQLISEAEAVAFVAKDKVYFAHPIFKKDSEDAAIVKNATREKMPASIILDPARILRKADPPNVSFNLGFNCIRHSKSVVFITSDRGFITKGVFREIQHALQLQREILFVKIERFATGLCKLEILPIISKTQIKNLRSNNPNEFGRVLL